MRHLMTVVVAVVTAMSTTARAGEIHEATRAGDLPKVQRLLAGDPALVNARDIAGMTPLHLAARGVHRDLVLLLVERGGDVTIRDANDVLPLHSLAFRGEPDLVALMIESAGFNVVDLGVDVPAEKFIEAINSNDDCNVVALSCLLTTTMPALKNSVEGIIAAGLKDKVKIIVGGAPITADYAKEIGADGTAEDAASAADLAKKIIA